MRRLLWLSVLAAIAIAYPLLLSSPFQQRLGALVLLYAMLFGFVDPESGLGILISVKILIMAALNRKA